MKKYRLFLKNSELFIALKLKLLRPGHIGMWFERPGHIGMWFWAFELWLP